MEPQLQASGNNITRRAFLGFFALGGIISLLTKRLRIERKQRPAMFWKRRDG
ncbi:MAG: hypothetical protein HZA15_05820 [Nitrospirae bacterium]|nr:hypothetical protein [Nitrospirota bacterium]